MYVTDLDKCDPVLSGQHSQHIPPVPAYNVVQPFNAAAYPGPPPSLCNDPQGILPGEVQPHQSTLPNYNAPLIQTTTMQIPGNYQSATSSTGQVLNEPVVQTMTAPEANPNDPSTNEKSVHISCPFCHLEITTSTEYVSGSSTYLCFLIIALTG